MARPKPLGIREAIQTLTSILSTCGIHKVPSETFRQAKFNNPSVAQEILRILYAVCELVSQLTSNKGRSTRPEQLHITLTANITPTEEKWILHATRTYLHFLGYRRIAFFTEKTSSREMLLALGWIILKYNVVTTLRLAHITALNRPLLPSTPTVERLLDLVQTSLDHLQMELQMTEVSLDKIDLKLIQKMTWIRGHLEKEWINLYKIIQAHKHLSEKVHQYTHHESKHDSLSLHEIYLLRYPELLKEHMTKLEKQIGQLQYFLDWESSAANVFGQWLLSVLQLAEEERRKEEEGGHDNELDLQTTMAVKDDVPFLKQQVESLQSSVRILLVQNQPHLEKLKTLSTPFKLKITPQELKECESKLFQTLLFRSIEGLEVVKDTKKEHYLEVTCSWTNFCKDHSETSKKKVLDLKTQNDVIQSRLREQIKLMEELVPNSMSIVFQ